MPIRRLLEFPDQNRVNYEIKKHPPAFTAQAIASLAHIPGGEMVKTVMVKVEGKMAMAVLPAANMVDFEMLRDTVGCDDVQMARESEFRDMFPDCELGAMPPFGNLYGLGVYVAEKLTGHKMIAFNACSQTEVLIMQYADFERLVKPKMIKFAL
nr:YbaK/EbsC family protein [candidate division Zixibacteria bacterium]